MPKIEQFRCEGNASVTGEQSAKSWNGNDDDNSAKMSLERPPSQNMSGTSIIETQPPPASQQIASVGTASNNTTAAATSANMVLSTIPIESGGHVVIHHQQSSTVSNGTNGAPTYTQIARNGMPQNLISAAVVSSSATQLTTKAIPAIAATSSPSKYVVIHPNGAGQYRTADGTTAAYLTAQSNGVGNIVLLATEPMDMTGGEQSNIIVNTSGQAGDEELTSLNWLQDKNLLKDLVVRPNGTQKAASTSPSRQTNGNGAGAISPTSDFQEDSSVSEDNVSSVNSSSDQGISISSSEFSPTSSTSSTSSVPSTSSPSAATFTTYHPQQQPNIQYHQVTVATTTHQSQQGQQLHQIAAPHFINNNSLTKNRNHLLSPNKGATTFSQSLPATAYTLATDINAPRTVTYNGKSGTTTVVEYKAGSNFSPSAARQLISSHTLLSPQRSPPISEKTTVTITSASASTTNGSAPTSPVSSTIGGGGGGGGGALTIVTSTPAGTPHQHFHKRYIREQMNGGEPSLHQHQLSQRKGHEVAVEYVTNGMVNSSQSQHYHCGNGSESEDYLRTPIKRESMSYSSGNHSPDDRLMTRESLNFESPTTIPNGRPVSLQKASSSSSSSTSAQQSAAASPKQKHPTSVPYDPLVHTTNKPPYSFSSLIFMAIEDSPEKALPVKEIYAWIVQHFPYFKTAPTGWKNSVRHNLSLNKSFLKVEKAPNMGKGSLWRVEEHQRPNLIQALARSPFHQSSAVDKFSPYKNGGAGAPVSSSRSLPPGSPPPPVKSNLDPELFPKLYKTINDMANKGVNGAAADSNRDDSYAYSNGTNGCYNGTTRDYYVSNGGENGTGNNSLMDYSIERLARDCGADSIDDVNAATAMLALKHGPNIFNEHFQNGSPVITSSPSEDHTYSAGGGGNGAATNGVSSAPNGCDNNSSGVCSDAAYESGDERHHRTMSAEELEEQRRHAEGVDALLSFASSAASSPAKRPSSASIDEEHISSCLETMPHYISSSENGAIATTRYITNDDGTEAVIYHHNPQRLSSSSSSSTAYETPSFYLSALPASAKKMKLASSSSSSSASRGIRQKIKRKTASSR